MKRLSTCFALLAFPTQPVEARNETDRPAWGFFGITNVGEPLEELPLVAWSRNTGLHWSKLELPPGSGRYDWDFMDGLVDKARDNGYNLVFVLKTGNEPDVSEPGCYRQARKTRREPHLKSCPIREKYEPAWKRLVGAVIERYDGDGKEDMPGLPRGFTLDIQIENEAGSVNYWCPGERDGKRAARPLLRVLQLAYEAKEAANPSTRIIAPGISHPHMLARCAKNPRLPTCSRPFHVRNRDLTEELLKHPQYYDAVDVHFFNYFRFDPFYVPDSIAWVRERMGRTGEKVPIYSLEWTGAMMQDIVSGGHGKEFLAYFPFRDVASAEALEPIYKNLAEPRYEKYRRWFELEQAREFPKLFTTLLAHGVERLIYVPFHDYVGQGWNSVFWNWQGIVRYEGTRKRPVLVRKPVYYTYRTLASELSGFQSVEVVSFGGDYFAYKFLFPEKSAVGVAWTASGERTVDLSRQVKAGLLAVTPLLTTLDSEERPVAPKTHGVKPAAVPLSETPVLIGGAEVVK